MESPVIFYNETTLNGKFDVWSEIELDGLEHRKFASDFIHTHQGEIYKNLKTYSLNKRDFEKLKKTKNLTRTSFSFFVV